MKPTSSWQYESWTWRFYRRVLKPLDLGYDDQSISTVDESGVALAAIQELNQKLDDQTKRVDEKGKEDYHLGATSFQAGKAGSEDVRREEVRKIHFLGSFPITGG